MNFALEIVKHAINQGMPFSVTADGNVQFGVVKKASTKTFKPLPTPKQKQSYKSDSVKDLSHGSVANQIRANFKKVGGSAYVYAHCTRTIYSTVHRFGYSCNIVETEQPNKYYVTRVNKKYR
jgi:hypothetical protein